MILKTGTVDDLVGALISGINHGGVHHREHPRVLEAATEFTKHLQSLCGDEEDGFFLGIVDGHLVSDGKRLLGPTLIARRLIQAAGRFHTGGFLFLKRLSVEQVARFFLLCTDRTANTADLGATRRLMAGRGLTDVAPSPLYGEPGWLGDHWERPEGGRVVLEAASPRLEGLSFCYQNLLEAVEKLYSDVREDRDVVEGEYRAVIDGFLASYTETPSTLLHLSRYPDYDSYTVGHSVRVALLSVLVSHRLGFSRDWVLEIGTAALVHDAGKGKVPHEILYKQGPLDAEERAVLSTHPMLGAEALLRSASAGPFSIAAAFGHHLRNDRLGYPTVADWLNTSGVTSLIQVCDVFEALTAVRPYKPSLTPRRSYEIMMKDPAAFHPGAFAALFRTVGFYPPGARVLLDDGSVAFVLAAGSDPERPVVELTHDVSGAPIAEGDRPKLDLGIDATRSVEKLIEDDECAVDADPRDYADRPLTVITQGAACVHPPGTPHAHAHP